MNEALSLLSTIPLVGAGFFALIAGLGLVRFPDLASRMHGATKASGAAFALALIAVCLRLPELDVVIKSVIAFAFAFLTLPVAAHLLARGAIAKTSASSQDSENPEKES